MTPLVDDLNHRPRRTYTTPPRRVAEAVRKSHGWALMETLPQGGTVSIPGVYVGMGDKIPLGAAMNKGLTFKMGQTHVQAYTKPLLARIEAGEIDPSFVITHPASLEDAPEMYRKFRDKEDGCIKVVLKP